MFAFRMFPFQTRQRATHLAAALLAAGLALGSAPGLAQTQAHAEIAQLLQAGQARQALTQAQRAIEAAPRDPQLQFLKANAELALGETAVADATLTALTQTYPELPEPWNNLAVIRAGQGQLDEAQRLLQEALRNNPDYAQAHANLADVLVQQALQHLSAAQRLDPQAGTAQRLQALQQAVQAATGSNAPQPKP
ncbi:MAG: tetratricopeptide repeat protein [Comamonadaceae bacterium]|nr:tetratricopeptide repeat protein [Comamonadaceae bacterium]